MIYEKYIAPASLEEWVRNMIKRSRCCSIICKAILSSFQVIGDGLAWKVGRGNKVRIGVDPWPGSGLNHRLLEECIQIMNENGIHYLNQVSSQERTNIWGQGWKNVASGRVRYSLQ
jgi:hypothetical protein